MATQNNPTLKPADEATEILRWVKEATARRDEFIKSTLVDVRSKLEVLKQLGQDWRLTQSGEDGTPKPPAQRTCSICHQVGHRAPQCPKRDTTNAEFQRYEEHLAEAEEDDLEQARRTR